jgi:lycopene beta-cyclase
LARRVSGPYASIHSDRFSDAIVEALGAPGRELRTNAHAVAVGADRVELADGSVVEGLCVIDARGPLAPRDVDRCGYQKFLGLEVVTDRPWPDDLPTVMNANVPQDDGYRFTYALPFGPRRVLVEDTYFSDTPALNRERSRHRVAEQIEASGVGGWRIVREEFGVLPMPWHDAGLDRAADDGPIGAGFGGGWFHPATGYSFPMAARLAKSVAQQRPDGVRRAVRALAGRMRARRRFALFLNFLMFRAVVPGERWQIFRRLYRELPDEAMARFYAMEFTAGDAARILVGWPPPLAPLRLFRQLEVLSCPSVSS